MQQRYALGDVCTDLATSLRAQILRISEIVAVSISRLLPEAYDLIDRRSYSNSHGRLQLSCIAPVNTSPAVQRVGKSTTHC